MGHGATVLLGSAGDVVANPKSWQPFQLSPLAFQSWACGRLYPQGQLTVFDVGMKGLGNTNWHQRIIFPIHRQYGHFEFSETGKQVSGAVFLDQIQALAKHQNLRLSVSLVAVDGTEIVDELV